MKWILTDYFTFFALLTFVLIVNLPAISYSMVYFEQAPIYLANQQLHSFLDLFKIYFKPEMLYAGSIPFFRPTGHFLMYQIITPFIGWHNLKILIMINLVFLTLTGFFMIKLYSILFPRYKIGGYIAFSIYMMHPALILSHLMAMHFDFAYAFFCILSLYWFALFCQKNNLELYLASQHKLNRFHLLLLSLFSYIVAMSFKETAIMLGPVLILYFLISLYSTENRMDFIINLFRNRQALSIFLILMITCLTLALYFSLSRPSAILLFWLDLSHKKLENALHYFQYIFAFWNKSPGNWTINYIHYPLSSRFIIWFFSACCMVACLFYSKFFTKSIKKSLVFLFLSFILFLLLPINWSGWPWHLNLSLIFISLIMGFSFEFIYSNLIKNKRIIYSVGIIIFLLTGLSTSHMILAHTHSNSDVNFTLSLNKNALFHPPNIKNQLNPNSIIIIEDSQRGLQHTTVNAYKLGDSFYPFENEITFQACSELYFLKPDKIYGGLLFKWAYLMPSLKEEIYPFKIENMRTVPDLILKNWIQHSHHIFCLGYDREGNWHDYTPLFKKNLLKEKIRRTL